MSVTKRTPCEWFHEATRSYVEGHQACAWCGGQHRVFKSRHDERIEYSCIDCHFYVCHDTVNDSYEAEPGQPALSAEAVTSGDTILDRQGCFGAS